MATQRGVRQVWHWWRPLLVWAVVVVTSAIVVAQAGARDRQALADQFTTRTSDAGSFLSTYVDSQEVLARVRAQDLLASPTVTSQQLQVVVSGLGFASGAVLDSRGRVLMNAPYVGALIGRNVSGMLEHIRLAVQTNRPAVSQVVVSPALKTPVVAIAVPYDTPLGRRIFSPVFRIDGTALASQLRASVSIQTSAIYLVDRDGHVIAASSPLKAAIVPLASLDPDLGRTLAGRGAGTFGVSDGDRYIASTPVGTTGWRLITAVGTGALYQSLGSGETTSWLLVGALDVAALLAASWYATGSGRRARVQEVLSQERETARAMARVQQVLDVLPESVTVYDAQSRVISMNGAAVSLLGGRAEGRARDELDFRLRLPDGTPMSREETPAVRALTAGETTRGARVLVRDAATGRDMPLVTSCAPLHDATGAIAGAVSVASDISRLAELERQSADLADQARAERDRLHQIVEVLPVAVILFDPDGRRVLLNRAAKAVVGADLRGQPVPADYQDSRHPDGTLYAREELPVFRAMRTGEAVLGEQMLLRNLTTGEDEPILVNSAALTADDGTVLGGIVVFHDLSQIAKADLLRQNALIARAHDAFIVRDLGGHIFSWNPAAEKLYGWRAEEVMGHSTHDVLHTRVLGSIGDGAPGPGADTDAALAADDAWEGELEHQRRDGSKVLVESRQALLRDRSGLPVAILEINRDITARKAADLERRALLEQARAAAAAEHSAREAAEQALRVADEFLATAAHELKTPLTSLLGLSQTLLMLGEQHRLSPERSRQALQGIVAQSERIAALVDRLFDLALIETGRLVLTLVRTDLRSLCAGAVAAAQATTTAHAITLEAPGPLWARVDTGYMRQVLRQLLDNAVKFTPESGHIAVSLVRQENGAARLAVRDHGLGVPLERRAALFGRLGQAHADSYRSGLGLGLYLCRQIVERHGGTLEAEFPTDGGSCFVLTLPDVDVPKPAEGAVS